MFVHAQKLSVLAIASVLLVACGDDSGDPAATGDTAANTMTSTGGVSDTTPVLTTDDSDTTPGDTDNPTTGNPAGFEFDETPPEQMVQVDRVGMPAVNTVLITSKDDYNAAGPDDDIAGTFVPEIVASLEGLHDALDDDIAGFGLVACAVDDCVAQGAPLVIPDAIAIDPAAPAGFPNGRLPADQVIDITLAVIMLDLSTPGQTAATLAGVPLNPGANDVAFSDTFPFLADPH